MDNNAPLVNIITPVFNGIKYLETNVLNVLEQSYPNIEHIYVDGGSTDGTLELLAGYQTRFPERIKVVSEPAAGVGAAVNRGFALAKGQIFGWVDADDLYEPEAIEVAVKYFQEHPDANFLYGGCNMIDESGKVISAFTIKDFNLREAVTRWHYIVFCACFYNRQVIQTVGGLNPLGNDLDFYLRIYKNFTMHRISNTLANWRLHSGGISLNDGKRSRKIRNERVRQDFFLCLRNGGNLLSPRCVRYYVGFLRPFLQFFRPALGRYYPGLKKSLGIGGLYE